MKYENNFQFSKQIIEEGNETRDTFSNSFQTFQLLSKSLISGSYFK